MALCSEGNLESDIDDSHGCNTRSNPKLQSALRFVTRNCPEPSYDSGLLAVAWLVLLSGWSCNHREVCFFYYTSA